MNKTIIFFLSTFFLTGVSFAAEAPADNERKESSPEIARTDDVQTTDPRWYKSRSGRQEYLQGGQGSRHMQQRSDNSSNNGEYDSPPTSDPRWYKSQNGRAEYLKGGNDYRRGE
jgi:hypothetical protein